MALGKESIGILAGWTAWLVILPLIIEIPGLIINRSRGFFMF
jgi:hypothetical protein